MAQLKIPPKSGPMWHYYMAASSVVIAVLAAISSFQSNTYNSLILIEKNNSILYQNQANKEWNHQLANNILNKNGEEFGQKAQALEEKSKTADSKSEEYFQNSGQLANAGTLFEIAIALSSISLLLGRRLLWLVGLGLSIIGVYFLMSGLLI